MSLPLSYLDLSALEGDTSNRVQAVRIACDGEIQELDVPKYQSISISAYDDSYRDDYSFVSDLSRFIGLPVTARKVHLDNYWRIDLNNAEGASLFRNCDIGTVEPERLAFGAIPPTWSDNTGPIIIARLDKKPLHPLHAAALVAFSSRELRQSFQECMDAEKAWRNLHGAREMIFERRREVLAGATAHAFSEFFNQYKTRRVQGRPDLMLPLPQLNHRQRQEAQNIPPDEIEPRPDWATVVSPYDV